MTNDEYTDNRQALSQILDILNVIAAKKAAGENIRSLHYTESDKKADGKSTRIRYHREDSQGGQSLGEQAGLLTNKASKAFQEGRYDDAKKYLHDVLDIIAKLPDNNDHREAKAYMLNMLAGAECRQGLYNEAVRHLREAIAVCEQLPDEIKYLYAKETFEDNLEEVEHKMKQANEHKAEMDKESDESLLDALQNKSSKDKKYKSQKDIEANYHFTNEKPKESDDVTMKLVLLLIMVVLIFVLLKFC